LICQAKNIFNISGGGVEPVNPSLYTAVPYAACMSTPLNGTTHAVTVSSHVTVCSHVDLADVAGAMTMTRCVVPPPVRVPVQQQTVLVLVAVVRLALVPVV